MSLLNSVLPEYDVKEHHEIIVNKPVEAVFEAANTVDFSTSKIIVILFKLRGIPVGRLDLQGMVEEGRFVRFGEMPPWETVLGFTEADAVKTIDDVAAFTTNTIDAKFRVAWNFQCEALDENTTRLSTETRVALLGTFLKIFFRCYWFFIKPFSGWIRTIMLRLIKEKAEAS
ncbi:hypothetical protein [Halodesulfovibrio sp.]|jgi:hypothetical protein|uniref:hypothetical protein n=1 Tax=Halodesulfovibrio sp. TaxID=1912772 RepID=UPI0025FDD40A|nr:hypothetical protein [Halodesulfovibrio sp.]MCT4626302.1 hypothetical protein [Halodesulfovibrio sp.]